VLAPLVVVTQVIDITLWWLARLDGPGPYFAYAVIGTGTVVGTGLGLQIVLSLFDMYGPKGKAVIAVLLAGLGAGGAVTFQRVVVPYLEAERVGKAADKTPPQPAGPSRLEKLLMWSLKGPDGNPLPAETLPRTEKGEIKLDWKGKQDGGMARAFFDKDGLDFKSLLRGATDEERKKLFAERDGERLAVLAWVRSAPEARQAAYESDRFVLPAELAGRPVTADYRADGGAVKLRLILTDRCARCHQPGAEKEDIPLHTFDGLRKYLEPEPAGDGLKAAAPPNAEPPAAAAGEPIPAAQE
jgi:hypothetical protein